MQKPVEDKLGEVAKRTTEPPENPPADGPVGERGRIAAENQDGDASNQMQKKPPELVMRPVRRRKINIDLPPNCEVVQPDTPLVPGTALQACWASKWSPLTVVEVHDDGAVKVKWDDWGSVYDMTREDLVISTDTIRQLQSSDATKQPAEREWSDTSGQFKIKASYVDLKSGLVVLRKSDGTEVSVPIEKLSEADQARIRELSAEK